MTQPRLVLVTRRFWPLVGGAERQMASLAVQLKRLGCEVTILTAHWEPRWPSEISHHGVRVVRLPHPTLRGWGTIRYMLAVGRWLRSHRDEFDLVYVSTLRHDAYAALAVRDLDMPVPVILRAEGVGSTGDCQWQEEASFGSRIARRCRGADSIVVSTASVEAELLAAGFTRLVRIEGGVSLPATPCTEEQRTAARKDLGRANPELIVAHNAPLAVAIGRLDEGKGLDTLIDAWPLVLRQQPRARLWLVGEGPWRPRLATQIERLRLRRRIMLAGTFDDVEQFLRAADLFVLPASREGTSLALLEAMAAGLPIVATDLPGNREVLGGEGPSSQTDLAPPLVTPGKPETLAEAILRVFDQPAEAQLWGAAGRERVGEAFSIVKMAERHLELFEQLISARRSIDSP